MDNAGPQKCQFVNFQCTIWSPFLCAMRRVLWICLWDRSWRRKFSGRVWNIGRCFKHKICDFVRLKIRLFGNFLLQIFFDLIYNNFPYVLLIFLFQARISVQYDDVFVERTSGSPVYFIGARHCWLHYVGRLFGLHFLQFGEVVSWNLSELC